MKLMVLRSLCIFTLFLSGPLLFAKMDSLNHSISFNYYTDLSDTYGSGSYSFSGEYTLSSNWYGIHSSFNLYQSQSSFVFDVLIEEIDESFEIPVEEMAIMRMGSVSGLVKPIKNKWLEIDILFGAAYGKASHSVFKSLEYTYDITERRITSLIRDYMLVSKNHFGYQAGLNVSFLLTKKFGVQLNGRMNDMSNGVTLFLVGGGLVFKL